MTLYTFPKLPFIRILYDNTSVFRPRSWRDASMTHNSYLPCLNAPINLLPFSITASFHLKALCAHVPHVLIQVTHIKLSLLSTQ
ncbi:unnamed protein product [Hymenolepis diminuta]|uniref:Uncharacterized protein n=1 Tax=Hymenolepis diminuta TaxID=6216 RepID=A0A564YBC1_HYMDI|nr:unnamed protein product [Hymenolepis diminuta]